MAMKWRKKDEQTLKKQIARFNASIKQLSLRNPEIADAGLYPSMKSYSIAREDITSRKEYNNFIKSIERWFQKPRKGKIVSGKRKGAVSDPREIIQKGPIKTTRWAYNEVRYATQRIEAAKKKRYAHRTHPTTTAMEREMEVVTPSQKLKEISAKIERAKKNPYSQYGPEEAAQSWATFEKMVYKRQGDKYMEELNARFYNNYLTTLYENFGYAHYREMVDKITEYNLDGEMLFQLVDRNPELFIEYLYGPEQEENKYEQWMDTFFEEAPKIVKEFGMDLEEVRKKAEALREYALS